jgi:8-oxo-dGTP diphosphatase
MQREDRTPILAASVCIIRDGRVLMVRRPEDVWAFPGGKVEPGETIKEAAIRELFEETGVTAEISGIVGQFELSVPAKYDRPAQDYSIVCLAGTWISGSGTAQSDALEAKWVPLDHVKRLKLAPNIQVALDMACNLQQV